MRTTLLLENATAFIISANGEKMLYKQGDQWRIAGSGEPVPVDLVHLGYVPELVEARSQRAAPPAELMATCARPLLKEILPAVDITRLADEARKKHVACEFRQFVRG